MLVQTVSYHLNDLNLWCVSVFRTLKTAPSVTPKHIGQLWVTCFCMCNYITSHVYGIYFVAEITYIEDRYYDMKLF